MMIAFQKKNIKLKDYFFNHLHNKLNFIISYSALKCLNYIIAIKLSKPLILLKEYPIELNIWVKLITYIFIMTQKPQMYQQHVLLWKVSIKFI